MASATVELEFLFQLQLVVNNYMHNEKTAPNVMIIIWSSYSWFLFQVFYKQCMYEISTPSSCQCGLKSNDHKTPIPMQTYILYTRSLIIALISCIQCFSGWLQCNHETHSHTRIPDHEFKSFVSLQMNNLKNIFLLLNFFHLKIFLFKKI